VPGARIAILDAAHISNVEQPQAYTDTMLGFLLGK
jgi:3-oxoadipate enol-lactonase